MPEETQKSNTDAIKKMPKGLALLKSGYVKALLQAIGDEMIGTTISDQTLFYKSLNGVHTLFIANTTTLLANRGLVQGKRLPVAELQTTSALEGAEQDTSFKQQNHRRYIMPIVDINLRGSHIGVLVADVNNGRWSFVYIDPKWPSMMTRRIQQKLQAQYPDCQFRAIETNQQAWLNDTTCGYHMLANIEAILTLLNKPDASIHTLTTRTIREEAARDYESSTQRAIIKHNLGKTYGLAPLPFSVIWQQAIGNTYELHRYVDKSELVSDIRDSDYLMARKKPTARQYANAFFDTPASAPTSVYDWLSWGFRIPLIVINHGILKPLITLGRMNDLALQSSIDELMVMSSTGSSLGIATITLLKFANRLIYDSLRLIASPLNLAQFVMRHPLRALRQAFLPFGEAILAAFDNTYYVKDYQQTPKNQLSARERLRAFFEWQPIKAKTKIGTLVSSIAKGLYSLLSLPFNLLKVLIVTLDAFKRYAAIQLNRYQQQYQPLFKTHAMKLGELSYTENGTPEPSSILTHPPLPIFNTAIGRAIAFVTNLAYEITYPAMMPKGYWRGSWQKTTDLYARGGRYKAAAIGYVTLKSLRFIGSNIAIAGFAGSALPFIISKVAISHAATAISHAIPQLSKTFNLLGAQTSRLSGSVAAATIAGATAWVSSVASAIFQTVRRIAMLSSPNKNILQKSDSQRDLLESNNERDLNFEADFEVISTASSTQRVANNDNQSDEEDGYLVVAAESSKPPPPAEPDQTILSGNRHVLLRSNSGPDSAPDPLSKPSTSPQAMSP